MEIEQLITDCVGEKLEVGDYIVWIKNNVFQHSKVLELDIPLRVKTVEQGRFGHFFGPRISKLTQMERVLKFNPPLFIKEMINSNEMHQVFRLEDIYI